MSNNSTERGWGLMVKWPRNKHVEKHLSDQPAWGPISPGYFGDITDYSKPPTPLLFRTRQQARDYAKRKRSSTSCYIPVRIKITYELEESN